MTGIKIHTDKSVTSPQVTEKYEFVLKGIPSSPGINTGKAFCIYPEQSVSPLENIPPEKIQAEFDKLDAAIKELTEEFNIIIDKVRDEPYNVIAIIESNITIINDEFLIDSIKKRIEGGLSAISSVIIEFDQQKKFFHLSKDSLIRERSIELDHIKERLLAALHNRSVNYVLPPDAIVIAQSLTPSDLVYLKECNAKGIITEVGGIASHSSILARSFEIPAIIAVQDALQIILADSEVMIDGFSGIITVNPAKETIKEFNIRKNKQEEHKRELGQLIKLPAKTIDGYKVKLKTNIDFPEDLETSALVGAEGVGLVRSEHLIINLGHFPSEDEQYHWYRELAQRTFPNVVTIRAFDVGSDKFAEGMPKHESNPALGFRGIRFLLYRKDLFKMQLRAILHASKNKNVRLMIPMVSYMSEVKASLALIEECKQELNHEGKLYDNKMPFGIMIETPAAAIQSYVFAKHVNFFSIGTNDLTQYTLAADRTNELVSEYFDSFHPAVLKLIKMASDSAKANKIDIGICGEMAGHAAATGLLIGLGINELSVPPSMMLELKNRIRNLNYSDAVALADNVMQCETRDQAMSYLGIK
jgi:phosphoenolpyruvate-protein phosphotransferase (PTS system enzyme I)